MEPEADSAAGMTGAAVPPQRATILAAKRQIPGARGQSPRIFKCPAPSGFQAAAIQLSGAGGRYPSALCGRTVL
jgi:hypothetical protein